MEKITIGQAEKLTSPNPFAIVSVNTPEGKTNVMAVSWWTYASNNPATLAVCLSQKGYSGSCIVSSKHFGLSVVGADYEKLGISIGSCSGRNKDKVQEYNIKLTTPEGFSQPVPEGSRVCFSCTLTDKISVGDHMMYIGQVDSIMADTDIKAIYAMEGYSRLSCI